MLNIGSVKIPSRVLLAPLAGCSDLAFRTIAREHGASFCFFEMIDNNAITYGPKRKTRTILKTNPSDKPVAAQLLGREPSMMLKAAQEIISSTDISFLDINAACPVKKAVKKKTGAYLLRDTSALFKIIKTLVPALPVPVTVKIRAGYDIVDKKALANIAKGCESSGAGAIFVHGRTRAQGYAGDIDYAAIKVVKDSVSIPVVGSGNIFDGPSAARMFDETLCDGVFVARGAFGNPWIFSEIEEYLKSGSSPAKPGLPQRLETLKRHLAYIEEYNDSRSSGKVGIMRKVALWYLKGFPSAPETRAQVSVVKSYEKMIELIDSLMQTARQ